MFWVSRFWMWCASWPSQIPRNARSRASSRRWTFGCDSGLGLTMRTHNVRGQLVKSICDANMVHNKFIPPTLNYTRRQRVITFLLFVFLSVGSCEGRPCEGALLPDGCHYRANSLKRLCMCRARTAPFPTIPCTTKPKWPVNTHRQ